jgi:PAS domain-containing protein
VQERQRLQHLLAVSPAIIYSTQASGDFACTFVSENIRTIMGFAPEDMITDPKCRPTRLHPADGPRVFAELPPLIEGGGGAVVYRFRHSESNYIWVLDRLAPVLGAASATRQSVPISAIGKGDGGTFKVPVTIIAS